MGLFGNRFGGSSNGSVDRTVAKSVKLVKDANGAPAVDLGKVEQQGGVSLRKKSESAGVSLKKKNIAGIRAQVVVLLDHSGSMTNDYDNGKVQELTERALGFGLQVDVDGSIPIYAFDDKLYKPVDVTMQNYQGIVQQSIYKPYDMGGTKLARPLETVRDLAKNTDAPIFLCVVTDGNPWDASETTKLVCDLARYPVFIKFLAIRDVPYLRTLDDLGDDKRLLDNVDAKFFKDLSNVTDEAFADAMVDEWDTWVDAAKAAGILTD